MTKESSNRKKKKEKKKIRLYVRILFCFVFGYVVIGSVGYLFPPAVSTEYKEQFQTEDYYTDSIGVDRAISIDCADERFHTILRAIDNAEETLDMSYFFIKNSKTTSQIIGALLSAADRGVHIRIIIDGVKCGFTTEMGNALGSHENIEVAIYNPMNYMMPWKLQSRMHDKYIISDDRILVVGGGNIDDIYLCETIDPKKKVDDRMALVYNTAYDSNSRDSVLFQVQDYMNTMWNSDTVRIEYENPDKRDAQSRFREAYAQLSESDSKLKDFSSFNYYEATLPTDKISFIYNPINIGVKAPTEKYAMIQLMDAAQEEVIMETPYLIADQDIYQLLNHLGNSNRKCEVLCSSAAGVPGIDVFLFSTYLGGRSKLVETNVDLYEHQSTTYKHSKTYIVDKELTLIGSYNLCYHSYHINTDIMLVVDSREFAQHVLASSQQYKEESCLVGEDNRYDTSGMFPLQVPFGKRAVIGVLEYPMQLFRRFF